MVYTKGLLGTKGLSLSLLGPSASVYKITYVYVQLRLFVLVFFCFFYLLQCPCPTFCVDLLFRILNIENDLKLLASFLTPVP